MALFNFLTQVFDCVFVALSLTGVVCMSTCGYVCMSTCGHEYMWAWLFIGAGILTSSHSIEEKWLVLLQHSSIVSKGDRAS